MSRKIIKEGVCEGVLFVTASVALSEAPGEDESLGEGEPPDEDDGDELVKVQILFPSSATSLVPSLEDMMLPHTFALPTDLSAVHVAPESLEVQIYELPVAASLTPSLEDVMSYQ